MGHGRPSASTRSLPSSADLQKCCETFTHRGVRLAAQAKKVRPRHSGHEGAHLKLGLTGLASFH